jgi:hypothetical protein
MLNNIQMLISTITIHKKNYALHDNQVLTYYIIELNDTLKKYGSMGSINPLHALQQAITVALNVQTSKEISA